MEQSRKHVQARGDNGNGEWRLERPSSPPLAGDVVVEGMVEGRGVDVLILGRGWRRLDGNVGGFAFSDRIMLERFEEGIQVRSACRRGARCSGTGLCRGRGSGRSSTRHRSTDQSRHLRIPLGTRDSPGLLLRVRIKGGCRLGMGRSSSGTLQRDGSGCWILLSLPAVLPTFGDRPEQSRSDDPTVARRPRSRLLLIRPRR